MPTELDPRAVHNHARFEHGKAGTARSEMFLTFQRTIARILPTHLAMELGGPGGVRVRSLPTMAAFERRKTFLSAAICGVDSFGSQP